MSAGFSDDDGSTGLCGCNKGIQQQKHTMALRKYSDSLQILGMCDQDLCALAGWHNTAVEHMLPQHTKRPQQDSPTLKPG